MSKALLDTNVLVHAAYKRSPLYENAASLLDAALRKSNRFCIAPQNLIEFCAVVTRTRFVDPPLSSEAASRMVRLLYSSRRLGKIYPLRGTVLRAVREGAALGVSGPAWYDLFLAITMRDAGVSMIITENASDFSNFRFLTIHKIADAVESL